MDVNKLQPITLHHSTLEAGTRADHKIDIGNAVARAFVRAGWTTYGLIRNPRAVALLAAQEIIPLRGSPASPTFIPSLAAENIVFSVIVSTTEQHPDYISHYNDVVGNFIASRREYPDC